nr:hypothetical protein [Caldimonas sp.]
MARHERRHFVLRGIRPDDVDFRHADDAREAAQVAACVDRRHLLHAVGFDVGQHGARDVRSARDFLARQAARLARRAQAQARGHREQVAAVQQTRVFAIVSRRMRRRGGVHRIMVRSVFVVAHRVGSYESRFVGDDGSRRRRDRTVHTLVASALLAH